MRYEVFSDVRLAIAREKQVKAWRREKSVALISTQSSLEGSEPGLVGAAEAEDVTRHSSPRLF
jgi:hypothetical protein